MDKVINKVQVAPDQISHMKFFCGFVNVDQRDKLSKKNFSIWLGRNAPVEHEKSGILIDLEILQNADISFTDS